MFERIVLVVGMPRSGTSWLSQIVDSSPLVRFRLSPLFSYELKNAVNEHSSKEEYDLMFRQAYMSNSEFMDQTYRRDNNEYPRFAEKLSTPPVLEVKMTRFHNLLETLLGYYPDIKIVSIVRHPCGAINSWLNTPGEFPEDADRFVEWKTGACRKTGPEEFWGFEDWMKVTRMHMQYEEAYPDQFRIFRYEDLVDHLGEETGRLFDFLGLPLGQQTTQFLGQSQSSHQDGSYAVFKNSAVKERWRETLDPDIRNAIIKEANESGFGRFLS